MPYLPEQTKEILDAGEFPTKPGELNYILTQECLHYWSKSARNYQAINDIIGALEGCKFEFYRQLASRYEDRKIIENGNVYNPLEF